MKLYKSFLILLLFLILSCQKNLIKIKEIKVIENNNTENWLIHQQTYFVKNMSEINKEYQVKGASKSFKEISRLYNKYNIHTLDCNIILYNPDAVITPQTQTIIIIYLEDNSSQKIVLNEDVYSSPLNNMKNNDLKKFINFIKKELKILRKENTLPKSDFLAL